MDLKQTLAHNANAEKAQSSTRFFKTGKGEYGEGDVFIGITVPQSRKIAKQFLHLPLSEIEKHLQSAVHEERLIALFILVEQYKKRDKKEIVDFYLRNTKRINNWDLVDSSADKILGNYLLDKEKTILYTLAKSTNLWEKRISIVSTLYFIRKGKFEPTFKLVEMLMDDEHDLIHKACGWMLREVGKKNEKYLEQFLVMHYKKMPRTMLRYAIERFSEERRRKYLKSEL